MIVWNDTLLAMRETKNRTKSSAGIFLYGLSTTMAFEFEYSAEQATKEGGVQSMVMTGFVTDGASNRMSAAVVSRRLIYSGPCVRTGSKAEMRGAHNVANS
jgi:hypothetical protein